MRILASQSRVVSAVLGTLLMRKPTFGSHEQLEDERIDSYVTDDLPPVGMKVEVIGHVGSTRHVIPFLCCWTEDGWVVADTRRRLAFNVEGWRRAGV